MTTEISTRIQYTLNKYVGIKKKSLKYSRIKEDGLEKRVKGTNCIKQAPQNVFNLFMKK